MGATGGGSNGGEDAPTYSLAQLTFRVVITALLSAVLGAVLAREAERRNAFHVLYSIDAQAAVRNYPDVAGESTDSTTRQLYQELQRRVRRDALEAELRTLAP